MFPDAYLSPGRLWWLLAVAAAAVAYVVMQWRRKRYTVRFTNMALLDSVAPRQPGWRRHVPASLFIAGLVGIVMAYARPADEVRVPRERATIILAIDVSLSMEADDVAPTRLAAAQAAAASFIAEVPEKINVGLVTFDGIAHVAVPPTTDRDQLARGMADLRLGPGTAIGEAIFVSIDAIDLAPPGPDPDTPVPAAIVLMSDGETTAGRPNEEGVAAATERDVPVSTIAFGTTGGTIFVPGEGVTPVPVQPAALAVIAEQTGGTAYEAASEAELASVYEDIGSAIGFEVEEQEVTDRYVGFALAGLALTSVLSLAWFSRLP